MTLRQLPERFLVSFSFAGEQRGLVRAIAEATELSLGEGAVFFDEWYEHWLAGADADLKLQDIYGARSLLAVVCVAERYSGKPWTMAEHEAIRARLMQARASTDPHARDAILPIRVGDGEVPGVLFNSIVPDVRGRTAQQSAAMIVARLRLLQPGVASGPINTATRLTSGATSCVSVQQQALGKALEALARQYEAAVLQSVNAVDATTQVQAERQGEEIVRRMREIERRLAELQATLPADRPVPEPPTGSVPATGVLAAAAAALAIWREKLAYFQEQEAHASDAAQKFQLRKDIDECRGKILELGGAA